MTKDKKVEAVTGVAKAEVPTPTNNRIQATSTLMSNGSVSTEIINHLEKVNQAELEALSCGMIGSVLGTAYKLIFGDKLKEESPELRLFWFNTMICNSIPFFNNGVSQNITSMPEKTGQTSNNDVI